MRPIRRILVAVKDPSAKELPAVTKGAQLARAFGAHLELFHGISTPLYLDAYSYENSVQRIEQRTRDQYIAQLEKIAKSLRAGGLKVDVSATWDFPVYEAIVRRAVRDGSDLIVAERHAKRHIAPGLLQLTDWELLRTSQVPVLLVKTPKPYRRPVVLAAVDPAHEASKPATLDTEILGIAKAVSKALSGPLHAVNAYSPIPIQPAPHQLLTEEAMQKVLADIRRNADRAFRRLVAPASIPGAQCHLVGRHPIDAIEQTARKTRSSIVVIGAISRSGLKRFFFGNTAEALLDSLDCDMLVVKPPQFGARIPKGIRGARFASGTLIPGV